MTFLKLYSQGSLLLLYCNKTRMKSGITTKIQRDPGTGFQELKKIFLG